MGFHGQKMSPPKGWTVSKGSTGSKARPAARSAKAPSWHHGKGGKKA